ncbi:MAG: hypothetical protein ACR2MN_15290 [Acidimicrobiales bacterium]
MQPKSWPDGPTSVNDIKWPDQRRAGVAYHRSTVLERGDDHPGRALAYYASRGETTLLWGGASDSLGVQGAVDPASFEAVFGPGGARLRGRVSGWFGLVGRAWNWSSPPTNRLRSWG